MNKSQRFYRILSNLSALFTNILQNILRLQETCLFLHKGCPSYNELSHIPDEFSELFRNIKLPP